jgi:hypothetical protein
LHFDGTEVFEEKLHSTYLHEMMLVFADRVVATGKHALGLEDAHGEGPE